MKSLKNFKESKLKTNFKRLSKQEAMNCKGGSSSKSWPLAKFS